MAQQRRSMMFATGAVAGGLLVLAAYLGFFAPDKAAVRNAALVAMERPAAVPAPEPEPVVITAGGPSATAPLVLASACPPSPLVPATQPGDGQFALDAALASRSPTDPSAFLAVAREAAGLGRPRDAEVALIAACRIAEQASGARSAPVADIKAQIAQHYVALAGRESADGARQALLQRATDLYTDSAGTYSAALGKNASKTRLTERRLATLRDPAQSVPPPPNPMVVAAPAPDAPDTSRLGAARSTSLAERPPARNENLSQVDSDLERLYAQARAVSRDPAGMQQRHQQALAQRNACRGDGECLRQWYAQRKRQLFDEF